MFVQLLIAAFVVMAYFITMFVLAVQFIDSITILSDELNILAQTEPYYLLGLNSLREMIYGGEEVHVLDSHVHEIVWDT